MGSLQDREEQNCKREHTKAMRESGDCLTRCSGALSNLPGSKLQGEGLDVRNEGPEVSCDGDAWLGLRCVRGRVRLGSSLWTHTLSMGGIRWAFCPDGVLASPKLGVRFSRGNGEATDTTSVPTHDAGVRAGEYLND